MKKLLVIFLSLSCILSGFCAVKNGDKFVYRADENDEFEANEDYYWQLCTTRGLDEATTRLCSRFRAYEENKRKSIENDIRDLNNQIADIKANIMAQGQRLNDINNTIASVENQIKGIEIEVKTIEENIDDITNQIIERERKIEELNDGIKARMVALQSKMSLNSWISFIMGANSFVDLLRRINAINQFTSYDVSKIRQMEEEKVLLEKDKEELQAQKDELVKKRAELEIYKSDLNVLRQQAEDLIAEYHRQVQQLDEAKMAQQLDMSALADKIEEIDDALTGYYPSPGFIRPLTGGYWISSGCYYYIPGVPSSGFHPAADMAVGVGTSLYAIANGYVVATRGGCGYGWMGNSCNGGFGNYIVYMIEVNGVSYFVINAHLSAIYVSVGDVVHQGQEVLGLTGSSGSSSGPHLHVEIIRFGTMGIKAAVREYSSVGQIYYTMGRNINWACAYRGAPCYENALEKLGLVYQGSY